MADLCVFTIFMLGAIILLPGLNGNTSEWGAKNCTCFQSIFLLLHHTVRIVNLRERLSTPFHTKAEIGKLTQVPQLNTWAVLQVTPVWLNSSLLLTQFPYPVTTLRFHTTIFFSQSFPAHVKAVTTFEVNRNWAAVCFTQLANLVVYVVIAPPRVNAWSMSVPGSKCWRQWLVHKSPYKRKLTQTLCNRASVQLALPSRHLLYIHEKYMTVFPNFFFLSPLAVEKSVTISTTCMLNISTFQKKTYTHRSTRSIYNLYQRPCEGKARSTGFCFLHIFFGFSFWDYNNNFTISLLLLFPQSPPKYSSWLSFKFMVPSRFSTIFRNRFKSMNNSNCTSQQSELCRLP